MNVAETLELLAQYVTVAPAEQQHKARMLHLLASGSEAFSRENYTPGHFTASAFVLSPDGRNVLLILHSKLGLWLQPGGHVDVDDLDLASAARREAVEETGLCGLTLVHATPIDLDIHTIPARKDSPAHEHFDVRFLFRAHNTSFQASSDALAAKWVNAETLVASDTDESVLRAVRKIVARSD